MVIFNSYVAVYQRVYFSFRSYWSQPSGSANHKEMYDELEELGSQLDVAMGSVTWYHLPSGNLLHSYWKIHHFIAGKIHYFDWVIFNSYVKLPEGTISPVESFAQSAVTKLLEAAGQSTAPGCCPPILASASHIGKPQITGRLEISENLQEDVCWSPNSCILKQGEELSLSIYIYIERDRDIDIRICTHIYVLTINTNKYVWLYIYMLKWLHIFTYTYTYLLYIHIYPCIC